MRHSLQGKKVLVEGQRDRIFKMSCDFRVLKKYYTLAGLLAIMRHTEELKGS
jgi:hypothetical protein